VLLSISYLCLVLNFSDHRKSIIENLWRSIFVQRHVYIIPAQLFALKRRV